MSTIWEGPQPRIAVVDDDPSIRSVLKELLSEYGFKPVLCRNSAELLETPDLEQIDLAILDLKLDGENGLMLAQRLRERFEFPIVILTGTGDEVDKIVGLETGADDFLMKPFNPRELIARIRAILRRCARISAKQNTLAPAAKTEAPKTSEVIALGPLQFLLSERRLINDTQQEVDLTNSELRVLEFFLQNPNRPIDRVELLEHLGGDLSRYMDRTIDVLILRLRRKVEANPSKPVFLQTRRGKGYVFALEP